MRRLQLGTFRDEGALRRALLDFQRLGVPVVDVVSPYPIHGLDPLLGLPRSRIGWATLAGGLLGGLGGLVLQYWTAAVDWPLNVGGKLGQGYNSPMSINKIFPFVLDKYHTLFTG